MVYIWDRPIRSLPKIRLRSFLYEGTVFQKNQPEVSYKVVSILRVLTVARKPLAKIRKNPLVFKKYPSRILVI